ncbi:DUF4352 domain-containing protein [Pseudoclavibacter sp. VKM Ac-2867]|uniref:DUF4352 domain-containing protein n=1 Tax=Pseudoclavibacter sp. VKM Ac-2867 TaxID=2783829 RepID=UPI00188A4570|nr:DUF4352 domain-containing protein [Pseudoclavibacter sp. VKM Ac-2867]MBF4458078.1 DUF4352 domain-containing protein [Pseudoclavibacter sp. VKM Ac-2867]
MRTGERPSARTRAGRSLRPGLLAIAAVLVLLAVVSYVFISARATDRGSATLDAPAAIPDWRGPASELLPRGSVSVGGVQLSASEIQCGLPRHDWRGGSASAAGQFCVVDVDLRNGSGESISLAPDVFELADAAGETSIADDETTAYGTDLPAGPAADKQLPPFTSTRIHLVFDVSTSAVGPMELRFEPAPELKIVI